VRLRGLTLEPEPNSRWESVELETNSRWVSLLPETAQGRSEIGLALFRCTMGLVLVLISGSATEMMVPWYAMEMVVQGS